MLAVGRDELRTVILATLAQGEPRLAAFDAPAALALEALRDEPARKEVASSVDDPRLEELEAHKKRMGRWRQYVAAHAPH